MNVGDGKQVAGAGGDDLLRQMQKAHDEQLQQAEQVEGGAQFDRTEAGGAVEGADRVGEVDEADPVERRVMDTARRALDGEFDDPRQARGEVVETVVEERYSGMVDPAENPEFVESVKGSLVDDVAFKDEVDNMLLHAARRLGQQDAEG